MYLTVTLKNSKWWDTRAREKNPVGGGEKFGEDLGAKASSGQTEGDLGASAPSTSQMPVLPPKRDPTASCSANHSATQHWPTEHKGPAQRSGEREQE